MNLLNTFFRYIFE